MSGPRHHRRPAREQLLSVWSEENETLERGKHCAPLPPAALPHGQPLPAEKDSGPNPATSDLVDQRESLANDRRQGTFAEVQLPVERITRLHGIMLDLDPGLLRPDNGIFEPAVDPRDFFLRVQPMLNRHPLASRAEVRVSGTGLHAIIRLDPAVELHTPADQRRWAGAVQAVQRTLPVDPRQPGITALTRPIGSINGKTGPVVEQLREGRPMNSAEVEKYLADIAKAPFLQVAGVLLGQSRVSPCPVCGKKGSRLDCLERIGRCYRGCGRINLAQLFDHVYADSKVTAPDPGGIAPSDEVPVEAVPSPTAV